MVVVAVRHTRSYHDITPSGLMVLRAKATYEPRLPYGSSSCSSYPFVLRHQALGVDGFMGHGDLVLVVAACYTRSSDDIKPAGLR